MSFLHETQTRLSQGSVFMRDGNSVDPIGQIFQEIKLKAQAASVEVELLIDSGESLGLSFQNGRNEKFDQKIFVTAGFRVLLNGLCGYASTENLSKDSMVRAFEAALQNVQDLVGAQKTETLASRPSAAQWSFPSGEQTFRKIDELDFGEQGSLDEKLKMAADLEMLAKKMDPRVRGVSYSMIGEVCSKRRILNSQGLDQSYRERQFFGYAYPLVEESGKTKSISEVVLSRRLKDIKVEEIVKKSVQKSIDLLSAKKLPTGNYPVIIDKKIAQDFFELLKSAFSAKQVFEGKSYLAGKLNQVVAVPFLNIYDDPLDLRGRNVRPFDGEGNASKKVKLVDQGVLKSYLTNQEYAAKMNLPMTAHASRTPTSETSIEASTFIFSTGKKSLNELLSSQNEVVYLTDLSAFHSGFKSTTGDFSLPGQGYLYKEGRLVGAVDQFVVSGNIFSLLTKIIDFSNELGPTGHGVICADVLVDELSLA